MILLEVVDAEEREPVPPEVLASLRKARQNALEDRSQTQSQPTLGVDTENPEDIDLRQTKAAYRKESRFWRNAKIALVVYFVLFSAIGTLLLAAKWRRRSLNRNRNSLKSSPQPPPPPAPMLDTAALSSFNGTAIECDSWSSTDHAQSDGKVTSILQFRLPANETIHLHSNASAAEGSEFVNVSGVLRVRMSSDVTRRDALVTISKVPKPNEPRSPASICLLRSDIGWGVAIYVTDNITEGAQVKFDIGLELPRPQGTPLKGLMTYLPFFNQTFDSIPSEYFLSKFAIQGRFGSVDVKSIHAKRITVKTTAAEITGTFNATEQVTLETILAPIVANVSLVNSVRCAPTMLSVETGRGDVYLNVTLHEVPHNTRGRATFFNTVKTFGGVLEATISHGNTTASSNLHLKALNSFQRTHVFVDSKFQGTFDVHTNLAEATVVRDLDIADPTGAGRRRTFIDDHVSSDRALGWVGWGRRPRTSGKAPPRHGHLDVVSNLSPAVLELTEQPSVIIPSARLANVISVQDPL